ncbi:hypothetical protein NL532_00130 [Mesorhizobium sp. C120A]|uniref:hypothetical protein n=1 Tax=unclassified Mesorhizobium TaxID=325217 RepID=UPI0003CFCF17|nr:MULTISPECIES: hypothetical protein [unclassified Mesorhizobium]ESZ63773.1 hypothetical protein X728_09215 [Mesorhizobium sp. L103C120A0]WJI45109.1 hypothetical protein NL532_00130 [Mesorhizobium sp. C120A]
MPIDTVTANRNWQLPNGGNNLDHDVARLIAALQAADLDVANILSTLVLKAPILNAGLTGAPTAPTPAAADNSNKIATTAWARLYFADIVGAAPAALDTIAELAAALQNDPSVITNLTTLVGNKITGPAVAVADNIATFNGTTGKIAKDSGVAVSSLAPKASPALTGVPTAPTAAPGTNTTQLATTAYADAIAALKANLASPTFTGVPAAPTAAPGTNTTQLATTAFAAAIAALKANLASPTFTGVPAAPTAAPGTNTTQLATTAFVASVAAGLQLQGFYESPQQTITAGGLLTLAHGLAAKPKLCIPVLQCTTADQGYAIGDELVVNPNFSATDPSGRGLSIVPTATTLLVRIGNDSFAYTIIRKDTGGVGSIVNASWKLVMRAWL